MIPIYMDENVDGRIVDGLRHRDVDVLTAVEDRRDAVEDELILDRAEQLQRLLFTQDQDFLSIARKRQQEGVFFIGVIFAPQDNRIKVYIDDLEMIAKASTLEEHQNRVTYLPM